MVELRTLALSQLQCLVLFVSVPTQKCHLGAFKVQDVVQVMYLVLWEGLIVRQHHFHSVAPVSACSRKPCDHIAQSPHLHFRPCHHHCDGCQQQQI